MDGKTAVSKIESDLLARFTKGDFNALVEVLQQSMEARGIPFGAQNRLLARLAPMHREIVTPRPDR